MLRMRTEEVKDKDMKRNATEQLYTISKKKFQRCFDQWKTFWNKDGEYKEKYFEEN